MKTIAALGALAVAGAASADLTGVSVVNMGDMIGDGTHTTYRLYANFDNPADNLLAINGDADISALRWSGAMLRQNAGPFSALDFGDVPSIFDEGGDSWVTVGINDAGTGSDTNFSPDFLGGDAPINGGPGLIQGSFFEQLDNGGYFDSNPGTPEAGGSVLFAQFTIANDAVGTYEGVVSYNAAGAGATSAGFIAIVPAPGAVALLGLAGLAGTRRRRA